MPKIKTHSGTKKRARITKTGKVMRRHATGNHFLEKKSASRKRRIAGMETTSTANSKTIRRQLGA